MNRDGVPTGVPQGNQAGSASGPRGGAVAGAPCWGLRRGGGGKSAALPLTGWLAAGAGGGGSGGSARPGDSLTPVPPSAARGWAMDARWGGETRAAMTHVTETPGPRDRDPRAWEAGWGSPSCRRAWHCREPVWMGAQHMAYPLRGSSGSSRGGGCATVVLRSGKEGGGAVA